jgi:N-acetylglutamate synthase-like GNAT family acetyltransferase
MKIQNIVNNPQYIEVVSKWIYTEFFENIRHGISYDEIFLDFSSRKKGKIPYTFVGIEKGVCVGTVSLFSNDLKKRIDLTPWLGSLYVSTDYGNKAIAKHLIDKVTKTAKLLGYETIYLRTEHASNYYLKSGWKLIYSTIDEFGLETEVFNRSIKSS